MVKMSFSVNSSQIALKPHICFRQTWNKDKYLQPETLRTYYSGIKNRIKVIDPELHVKLETKAFTISIDNAFKEYNLTWNKEAAPHKATAPKKAQRFSKQDLTLLTRFFLEHFRDNNEVPRLNMS